MYGASINQEGGNMFGNSEDENKNKIANIMDVLEMQDDVDVEDEDIEDEDEESKD